MYARLGYRVVNMDSRAKKLVGDVLFGRSVTITKLTLEKRLAFIDTPGQETQAYLNDL